MVPREQEEWLLQQALAQGALQAGDLACVPGPSSLPSASSGIQYGPRIDLLVRRGCLDEHVVRGLLAEIAAQEVTCSGAGAADGEAVELPLAQAPSLIIPSYLQDWARYAIESCLGRGGMGVVYKAYDLSLERTVALKFMHGADLYTAQRFLREARAQARICHPAVCQVYEVAEYAGLPYIAMEYLPGQPLHLAFSSLSLEEKAYIVRDVALALQAAHGLGIIHRGRLLSLLSVGESGT